MLVRKRFAKISCIRFVEILTHGLIAYTRSRTYVVSIQDTVFLVRKERLKITIMPQHLLNVTVGSSPDQPFQRCYTYRRITEFFNWNHPDMFSLKYFKSKFSQNTTNCTVNCKCGDIFRLTAIIRPIFEPCLRYIK